MTARASAPSRKRRIWLVQQSVWRAEESTGLGMPLAAGYLKAMVDADPARRAECEVRIFNFSGSERVSEIVQKLFRAEVPDAVGFSVLGWNYHVFGRVSATFRQLNPDGWVVWGGNHVANQARRVFAEWPAVDVIVNGEGELTFVELVTALLEGRARHDLADVAGISFRPPDGAAAPVTTPERARILDLDRVPSPILTGSIPLTDAAGRFLYDAALLETNRGCPYSCAFCYWGGAIGQKVRAFPLDRLRAEIDRLARLGVRDVVLCDANFGMLPDDEAFLEICIEARERHGWPRHIMTSWAKNKGKVFHRMVRRMTETGFHAAFNLALQSLSEPVLEAMGRRNMKVNDWESLAEWLHEQGLDVYGELIWGCPGETVEGFLEGYDRLARHVTRIAVYPHLIMPNTRYHDERAGHGFVTWRPAEHDFEFVLAHRTMSIEDNRRMHRFLFWARVVAEHLVFRHVWQPLHELAGLTQSAVLLGLDRWLDAQADEPVAAALRAARDRVVDTLEASSRHIEAGLQRLHGEPGVPELLTRWWRQDILPRAPEPLRAFLDELFRYDLLTLPVYRPQGAGGGARHADLEPVEVGGEAFYRRRGVAFAYDVAAIVAALRRKERPAIEPAPVVYDIFYRQGFCNDMRLYHNAHNLAFFGVARAAEPAGTRTAAGATPVAA